MKKYTRPELEITEFELEDILTLDVSGNPLLGGGEGGWY